MFYQPVMSRLIKSICIGIALVWLSVDAHSRINGWMQLEPGLELAHFAPADDPDVVINVLRIDPEHFEFKLLNASADNGDALTPKQWAQEKDLVAVINASMFQQDLLTSVSLMRTDTHVNNSYVSKDKSILAFGPRGGGVPEIKMIDRECDDFEVWGRRYHTLVQSIRMVSCKGENVWRTTAEKWSVSSIGIDEDGKVLFIQTETAFDTHDLIDALLQLPLKIRRAMYVEGGPQAQLYVNSNGEHLEFVGQVGSFFQKGSRLAWPIPNVIGIARK